MRALPGRVPDLNKPQIETPPAQEHLGLLRQLVRALPGRFPDLAALAGGDAETDPLLNLAHLQLHRRTRALARLAQVLPHLLFISAGLDLSYATGYALFGLSRAVRERQSCAGRTTASAGARLRGVQAAM